VNGEEPSSTARRPSPPRISPTLCERVLNQSNFLRFHSSVKPKEGELAIIATAREKDCPFMTGLLNAFEMKPAPDAERLPV